MISITEFKAKVTPKLHGSSLSKVSDFYGKMGEAANQLLLRTDPYSTIRRHKLENAIYDRVYNYSAPADLKGVGKVIDIRPIGLRDTEDYIQGTHTREFDIRKDYNRTAVEVIDAPAI